MRARVCVWCDVACVLHAFALQEEEEVEKEPEDVAEFVEAVEEEEEESEISDLEVSTVYCIPLPATVLSGIMAIEYLLKLRGFWFTCTVVL